MHICVTRPQSVEVKAYHANNITRSHGFLLCVTEPHEAVICTWHGMNSVDYIQIMQLRKVNSGISLLVRNGA